MSWLPYDTSVVLTGAACAIACALPGCFLVLRRMSMMGDAISHAVLPGLAAAFLISHSRANVAMFIGAALVGVLTAVFTQWVAKFGKVDRGAAMGIVFTTLFAIGLLMIRQAADHVDLDPNCVLMGVVEITPLDSPFRIGTVGIPRAALVLGGVASVNLFLIILFFKEFKISAFDPELATSLGINATLMHYVLMVMVAVTTVAAFEAVGSIIVIAMLIVPATTASLLTHRLPTMLALAAGLGAAAAVGGHGATLVVPGWFGFENTSTSGMMATVSGLLFVGAWLFAPRSGLLSKRLRRRVKPY